MDTQNRLSVSIIVVSWKTRDILRDCLQSVYEETMTLISRWSSQIMFQWQLWICKG